MNVNIEESIKNHKYKKFDHLVPEGFVLIPETMLEELQDFDVWKEWKSNSDFFQQLIRKHIDKMD
jgi:hypothetical protein